MVTSRQRLLVGLFAVHRCVACVGRDTCLKGVTGTSQLHPWIDGVLLAVVGTSAGAHIALGWIDSWQAVAYPCQVVELSLRPSHT